MSRFTFRNLVATAIGFGAITAGSVALAGTNGSAVANKHWVSPPAAAVVQHRPFPPPHAAPVQPRPAWVAPHAMRDPRGPSRFGDSDRDGVPNLYDRDSRFYDVREARRHMAWGDFDRDGVPNRHDRAPRNPRRY